MNINGASNTFVGKGSGDVNNASNNTFVGAECGGANTTGLSNTFMGANAGDANTDGFHNTFLGRDAGGGNIVGDANTCVGQGAGDVVTSNNNSFFGSGSGGTASTGTNNTFIGALAGDVVNTGDNNTVVGYNADMSSSGADNSAAIGANATCNQSNKVRIGNSSVTVIEGQVNFTASSDARFKRNVQENIPGIDFISRLRPVSYTWDIDAYCRHTGEPLVESLAENRVHASSIVYTGFLAQDVEAAAQQIGYDFSGIVAPEDADDNYGLRYAEFTVPLVKAVQEQQAQIELLQSSLATVLAQMEELENRISVLKAKLK